MYVHVCTHAYMSMYAFVRVYIYIHCTPSYTFAYIFILSIFCFWFDTIFFCLGVVWSSLNADYLCVPWRWTKSRNSIRLDGVQRCIYTYVIFTYIYIYVYMLAPPPGEPTFWCCLHCKMWERFRDLHWLAKKGCVDVARCQFSKHISDTGRWWSWSDVGSCFRICMKRSVTSCFERDLVNTRSLGRVYAIEKEFDSEGVVRRGKVFSKRKWLKRESLVEKTGFVKGKSYIKQKAYGLKGTRFIIQ